MTSLSEELFLFRIRKKLRQLRKNQMVSEKTVSHQYDGWAVAEPKQVWEAMLKPMPDAHRCIELYYEEMKRRRSVES